MESTQLRRIATYLGTSINLAVDPAAADEERWVVGVGLDAVGAGPTPRAALISALRDLVDCGGAEGGVELRRGRSALRSPLGRELGGQAVRAEQVPLLPELALTAEDRTTAGYPFWTGLQPGRS